MASGNKQVQLLARQLFKLSLVDGVITAEQVAGVLAYVEKHRPPHPLAVLKVYQRLVAAEIARGQAIVEHAGAINDALLAGIAAAMTKRYGRRIVPVARRKDTLLAGLRVRVGDDVYESSVAHQLAQLAGAV
jgi:F-type H+-transporting ATPase subunit delta